MPTTASDRMPRFDATQDPSSPTVSAISKALQGAHDASAMFNLLDVNGNGTLEISELIGGLSDLGLRDEMVAAVFIHMDQVRHLSAICPPPT